MTELRREDGLPDGRGLRTDRTRAAILAAAATLWAAAETPFDVTIADIAKRAKTGRRSVFRHFPTIRELWAVVHAPSGLDDPVSPFPEEVNHLVNVARSVKAGACHPVIRHFGNPESNEQWDRLAEALEPFDETIPYDLEEEPEE